MRLLLRGNSNEQRTFVNVTLNLSASDEERVRLSSTFTLYREGRFL